MISDAEFVAIKSFDRTLQQSRDAGQRIINAKNAELIAAGQIIQRLQARLDAANARAAAAERRAAGLQQQIAGFLADV